MQIEGFEQTFVKFIDSYVWYFDLYLINPVFNIFTKSTEAKRCTDITYRKLYFLSVIVEDLNL